MTKVENAARAICAHTERQRAEYMTRAARLLDRHQGQNLPLNVSLQVEELIYQAGCADARLQRFGRLAADAA